MSEIRDEISQCRALLAVVTQKLAQIEDSLSLTGENIGMSGGLAYPTDGSKGMSDSPTFLTGQSEGMSDGHTFLSRDREGMSDSPAFLNGTYKGMSDFNSFLPTTEEGLSDHNSFLPAAPAGHGDNLLETVAGALAQLLKSGEMRRVRMDQVTHTARFLCRVYQTGSLRNPHPVLAEGIGMSVSGIGKLVMSLRRRGWIETVGFQRYKLTDKGLGLVRQAAGV